MSLTDTGRLLRPVGDRALLVELAGIEEILLLQDFLMGTPDPGQLDVVAAAKTLLVTADSPPALRRIAASIRAATLTGSRVRDDTVVVIEAVYDGEDLSEAAALADMSAEALVAMHSGNLWTAAFGGFAPGFAYLISDVDYPAIPRRSSPRTSVPAGSVAMAGQYSAVYPGASPGGWQLIGRTTAPLWDPRRETPALINPGNRVQFSPVRELITVPIPTSTTAGSPPSVVVRSPGMQTTIQDLGRAGHADIGVTASGALDRAALRRANRLVGNPVGEAGLETVLGGLVLEAQVDLVLAVTGAPAPLRITVPEGESRAQCAEQPFALLAGERLELGQPASGFRSYVAFRGGVDVPAVLSSRATDLLSGLGPAPLTPGTGLNIGVPTAAHVVGNPEVPAAAPQDVTVFRYVPGPREDWFTPAAQESFSTQVWTVTAASNRIGLRLDGEPLERLRHDELASEGTVNGAIQVPPSGLPVFFLADHPVTGGYPVIGAVIAEDLDQAAQLAPGARVRFQPVSGTLLG